MEDNKIRVLHLTYSLRVGGAEVLLLHYIRSLGTERYQHYIYCFGDDGPIGAKIKELNVPICMGPKPASIKNPIKFVIRLLALMKDLLRFIRAHAIQVIQSHLGHANQLGVAVGTLAGVPAFPTVHNTMSFVDRRSNLDPRVHLISAVDAVVYRITERVVVVSQEIKTIVQNIYRLPDSKFILVKNGVIFQESSIKPANLALKFQARQDTLKIIAVGSLTYQKAFEILVRAVAELIKEGFDNLLVLIAGDGLERMRLEQEIQELDVGKYVKLLGIRDDVIELLKVSDIFVIPSRYEGLSIAMIEAMACGLPIVASDAPGLRNYINHYRNGLLFPTEDHKALAERIQRLANDENLRIRLSHGARESFEREYDMRRNIKSLDTLFRRYASTR
ncbi:MAG: glycosyltransferase [Bacteroidales bacterium]|nr:glycosyltransferase [Bacteroidales bacterium]